MKTNILFLSDLHLRPRIKSGGVELEGDCIWAIEQVAQVCRMVPDLSVILAGDIFDQRNVSPMELYLFKYLIQSSGIPAERWYTIQGNHDRGGDVAIPQSLGCTSLHARIVTIGSIKVWGYDHTRDFEEYREVVRNSPDVDIAVLHNPCKPFNNISENTFSHEDFKEHVLTVIGDTHICTEVHQGYKHIISPGSLFPQNKKELCTPGSCGGKLLMYDSDSGKRVCETKLIDIPLLSRPGLDLSEETDIDEKVKILLKDWDEKYARAVHNPTGQLKPVVYVNGEALSRAIVPGVIPIRVLGRVGTNPAVEPLKTAASIYEKVEQLVPQLCPDDPAVPEYVAIINSILATRDTKDTVRDVLEKKGVKFK